MTTAELVPTATVEAARIALAQHGGDLSALLRAINTEAEHIAAGTDLLATPRPLPPARVALTEGEVRALNTVGDLVAAVRFPQEYRELSTQELAAITKLVLAVKALGKLQERAEKAAKPAVFNHFDKFAERTGSADPDATPRDKAGFYAVKDDQHGACGLDRQINRTLSTGSATITVDGLRRLEAEGTISHREFLELTELVRVVTPVVFLGRLKGDPDLAARVAGAAEAKPPTLSMTTGPTRE